MATDGVKIIDSDLAHDTYCSIIDLYDNGATYETIRAQFPFPHFEFHDDFDHEIYTTAYALAMWEIGIITDDIIEEVRKVITKGSSVKIWSEEHDARSGKKRQIELDKFWNKINSNNTKIRKRKKRKVIDNFIFDINDVLAFQLNDNKYYTTVLLNVRQHRGNCTYYFGKILLKNTALPTIKEIEKCEIIGHQIPSGSGIDRKYIIGMSMTGIDHKNLINFTGKFTKIGNLNLNEVCKQMGSLGGATTFEELTHEYKDLENYMKVFQKESFKIQELLN